MLSGLDRLKTELSTIWEKVSVQFIERRATLFHGHSLASLTMAEFSHRLGHSTHSLLWSIGKPPIFQGFSCS